MRTYQNTASAILLRYDILYSGHKGNAVVGSELSSWNLYYEYSARSSSSDVWQGGYIFLP